MKAGMRREGERFRDIIENGEGTDISQFLYEILGSIEVSNCEGWF